MPTSCVVPSTITRVSRACARFAESSTSTLFGSPTTSWNACFGLLRQPRGSRLPSPNTRSTTSRSTSSGPTSASSSRRTAGATTAPPPLRPATPSASKPTPRPALPRFASLTTRSNTNLGTSVRSSRSRPRACAPDLYPYLLSKGAGRARAGAGPEQRTSGAGFGRLGLAQPVRACRRHSRRAVDRLDHFARIGDAGEDEVVVVGRGGVEVDVADLHQALVDALAIVDVLDPLQARLLDLFGDDPPLDVEPAVGDRVGGRHPFDEADQDGEGEDDEDD